MASPYYNMTHMPVDNTGVKDAFDNIEGGLGRLAYSVSPENFARTLFPSFTQQRNYKSDPLTLDRLKESLPTVLGQVGDIANLAFEGGALADLTSKGGKTIIKPAESFLANNMQDDMFREAVNIAKQNPKTLGVLALGGVTASPSEAEAGWQKQLLVGLDDYVRGVKGLDYTPTYKGIRDRIQFDAITRDRPINDSVINQIKKALGTGRFDVNLAKHYLDNYSK